MTEKMRPSKGFAARPSSAATSYGARVTSRVITAIAKVPAATEPLATPAARATRAADSGDTEGAVAAALKAGVGGVGEAAALAATILRARVAGGGPAQRYIWCRVRDIHDSARGKETELMLRRIQGAAALQGGRQRSAIAAKESLFHYVFGIPTEARRRTKVAVAGVYALQEMWPIHTRWRTAARTRLLYKIPCGCICFFNGRSALLHTSVAQAKSNSAVEEAAATAAAAAGGAAPPRNDPTAASGGDVTAAPGKYLSTAARDRGTAAAGGGVTTLVGECVTKAVGGGGTPAAGGRAKAAAAAGGCVTAGAGHTVERTSAAAFESAGIRTAVAAAKVQQEEAPGCATAGNLGSKYTAAGLADVAVAAAMPRAAAEGQDKMQEERTALLKGGQILADREGRGGDREMHVEKISGREDKTPDEVFAVAWEGVAGQRRQTTEFLETCSVGFEAVTAKLLRQLQAASDACRGLPSSAVPASFSPSAALPAGLPSSKTAATVQPSPDAAAAGAFSLDAAVASPAAVPADTRAAAAADIRTRHNVPERLALPARDTRGDIVERPLVEAIPVLFQDLACAHLLSAALQLRCPSLQQTLHAATAAAASLALHASAASFLTADNRGAAAASELGVINTCSLLQRSGGLQCRRRRHSTAAAENTPRARVVEETCWKRQGRFAGEIIHQQAEASTDCADGKCALSSAFSTDRHSGEAAAVVAAEGQPSATDIDASGAPAQEHPGAADVDITEARRPRGATHSGSAKAAAPTQTSNVAGDIGEVAAAGSGSAAAGEMISPISSCKHARATAASFVKTAAAIVSAEETALLLRCLGSGGELGTHTSLYLSQLFSFCFRTQNRQTRRANSYSISRSNVESPPTNYNTLYGRGEPAAVRHDCATEGVACTSRQAAAEESSEAGEGISPPTKTTNNSEDERSVGRIEVGRRRGRKKARGVQNMSFSVIQQASQDLEDISTMQSESQVAVNLVKALVRWTRARDTTSSSITNALQGYAWITCRRGIVAAVDWEALDMLLSPLLVPTTAAALSIQQCMDVFEALLLFDCRSTLPRSCLVVEALSTALLLGKKALKATDSDSASTFSPLQLLLWIVVLAKYRIQDDAVFSLAAGVLRPQHSHQVAHPALIAACTYAFGKFYGSSQQAIVLESMVVLARQLLHRFQLGDLSQLLISLTRADVSDNVLFARSAVKIKRNIAAILEGGEDAVAAWWRADPAVSAQQLVNLCLAFARQRMRDEKLFRGIAQLLLCLPSSNMDVHYHVNGDKHSLSAAVGLSCLTCTDIVNLLVAFSRVRILEQKLFQRIDELLVQHLLSGLLVSTELLLETLVAHSKVGRCRSMSNASLRMLVEASNVCVAQLAYRSPRLHHCLLLALAKCCCHGTSLKLSVRDRLRLVQAVDDLGLPLLPLLKEGVQKGVPAQLLRGTSAGDLSSESYAEEQLGLNSVPAWRRGSTSSKRRKRQKARKRKWTW